MILGFENQNKLKIVKTLENRLHRLKEQAEMAPSKSLANQAGNYLKYFATMGHSSTFSWDMKKLCEEYLKKAKYLKDAPTQENLDAAIKLEAAFEEALSKLVAKHPQSYPALRVDKQLEYVAYNDNPNKEDEKLIQKWAVYKQLKIAEKDVNTLFSQLGPDLNKMVRKYAMRPFK